MAEIDPIWQAMILGAHANILPTSFITIRHGDRDPDKAYFHFKEAIRDKVSFDVGFLDVGPGSAEIGMSNWMKALTCTSLRVVHLVLPEPAFVA